MDTHFYIDHAPPENVLWILQSLSPDTTMTLEAIRAKLASDFGVAPESVRSEWARRLFDLNLAHQKSENGKNTYRLTNLGAKLQQIEVVEPKIYPDLMHFLHFSSYDPDNPNSRKYFWSYRQCTSIAWSEGSLTSTKDMASQVQERMQHEFPHLDFQASVGARFDATAASRWRRWVSELHPLPFSDDGSLQQRVVSRFELSLLALDDFYRTHKFRYGDPIIIDEAVLDALAQVFFLEPSCCRSLIDTAARFSGLIRLSDTFAGTSVTLMEPYGIERI